MKYEIVYSSITGNTRELAEAIKEALPPEECLYFGGPEGGADTEAQVIFAGFWTDKGSCSEEMAHWLGSLAGKHVFLFGTAGFGISEEYFQAILKKVSENLDSSNTVIDTYMCQGRMQESVLKRYQAMGEQRPQDEKLKKMVPIWIDNYHQALAHPDLEDKRRLVECVLESVDKV